MSHAGRRIYLYIYILIQGNGFSHVCLPGEHIWAYMEGGREDETENIRRKMCECVCFCGKGKERERKRDEVKAAMAMAPCLGVYYYYYT